MKFILQLTGLVLTVSTLYVWSRIPVTSFDASVDANRLVAKEERPRVSQGLGSHASSLKAYGQSEVNKGNAGPIRTQGEANEKRIPGYNNERTDVPGMRRQWNDTIIRDGRIRTVRDMQREWNRSQPVNGTPKKASHPNDGGLNTPEKAWRKAKASWYTGPTNRTADGTRMRLDGQWAATRLVPMGTTIEIRNKAGKTWTIKRRDTPAKRYGDRLDLPKGFWTTVTGAKPSAGLVTIEWRVK